MSSLVRRAILSSQSSATKHLCSALLANHSAITVTTGRSFSASSITPSPIFHYTSVSSTLSLSSTSSYAPRRFFSSKYPDHIVLSMPALSPTMTKGNLAAWRKNEGDKVKAGDVLADVETDKATVAFESVEEGYLAKILIQAGTQDLAVGVPVAVLCDNQADIAAFKDFSGAPKPAAAAPAKAAPAAAAATPAASSGSSAPAASASSAGGRVIASPLAKKTAAESGVDLSQVKGTGPSNRIVAADVNEFKAVARPAAAAPAPAAVAGGAVPLSGVDYIDTPVSNVRRVIAERLSYSKNTLPHYYVSVEVTMDKVMKLRAELNGLQGEEGVKMSVNDFIVKASALALRKIPAVNSAWLEGANAIRQYNYVDISVAVSTETGLITPIVKDADLKGLSMIAADTKALASKARSNKLQPHEFQGGTFTISNLGMFGVKHFTAIINPPQSCILAVGAADTRVIPNPDKNAAADKPFVTSSVMTVTLSSDHRVVDGAVAAQWLQVFKKYLENPTTMLL